MHPSSAYTTDNTRLCLVRFAADGREEPRPPPAPSNLHQAPVPLAVIRGRSRVDSRTRTAFLPLPWAMPVLKTAHVGLEPDPRLRLRPGIDGATTCATYTVAPGNATIRVGASSAGPYHLACGP